jgi:hypothetical protein
LEKRIVACFDEYSSAQNAERELREKGLDTTGVSLLNHENTRGWQYLRNEEFLGWQYLDTPAEHFGDKTAKGNTVMVLKADQVKEREISEILQSHGAKEMKIH